MIEKRYVTLKVCKELEIEIDNDKYEKTGVRDLIFELIPDDIDGWEVLEAYVDQ